MTGQCPCGKNIKCRKSEYGWIIPRHSPQDINFGNPYRSIGNNSECLKSGSLRFRKDGSQTMLGGVRVRINGGLKYIKSCATGDYAGYYVLNSETNIYEPALKS